MTALAGEPATVGWYVYGIVAAGDAGRVSRHLTAARAIDPDRAVRVVSHGTLAAVVSEVDLREFGEGGVQPEQSSDRGWLEEKVRAHDGVLAGALGETAIVPLRFGTICREADDVRELLESRRAAFEAALQRVRGRVELGVKAFVDRERLASALRQDQSAEPLDAASGGRAYLMARQRDRRLAEEIAEFCSASVRAAHERLVALAADGRLNRPQSRELTGRDDEMLLNAAYLVDQDDERVVAEVASLARDYDRFGISFDVTGPWPPYNFVAAGDEVA